MRSANLRLVLAAPVKPNRSRLLTWVKRLLLLGVAGIVVAVAVGFGAYQYFDRDLPSVEALRTFRPPQVTKVACSDGSLCAEFYVERRTFVPIASLPEHVKNSFLAAEDADFYTHQGLDYVGMVRALWKTIKGSPQGASTISQQACRNLLLSQERKVSRKIKEIILTRRMEEALTKDQILELYVNQIYFGHKRYGVEEAALFYFGKHAKDLSLGEATVLAGTVQIPERINPLTNVVKAKRRQKYVLKQMAANNFAPQQAADAEAEKQIILAPRPPPPVGAYYAEDIRRMLLPRYGEDALMSGGLRIDIAMDPKIQAAADVAIQEGLEALDRRQGYRGAIVSIPIERWTNIRPLVATRIAETGKRKNDDTLVADLSGLIKLKELNAATANEAAAHAEEGALPPTQTLVRTKDGTFRIGAGSVAPDVVEGAEEKPELSEEHEAPPTEDKILARSVGVRPISEGVRLGGIVTSVDDAKKLAIVDLVGRSAQVNFSTATWARRREGNKLVGGAPVKMSDVLKPGDVIRIRVLRVPPQPGLLEASLDQVPAAQAALVIINPVNRHVVALSGGYDFARSAFNRATQAKRQPGSSFKPFLYGAAIASQRYTPISTVNDAPEAIRDPYTGKTWKPQNYEKGGFDGPMTLRQALTLSKNTVSVRLIEALTPPAVIDFARKAGINSTLPENLTLALGTGEVSPLEEANAYATLQSGGKYAEPILLVRVTDSSGKILEEHQAAFEERIPAPVAFLTTSLMRSVVEQGTATAVRELNRPAAGKTGTASEYRDAWFSGYTADYVATAWVGFDNHDPLGGNETGGKAALPIWLSAMRIVHDGLPPRDFEVPAGVTIVRVDPATGLLAGTTIPGREEPFLEGTQPTTETTPTGTMRPEDFFNESAKGGL